MATTITKPKFFVTFQTVKVVNRQVCRATLWFQESPNDRAQWRFNAIADDREKACEALRNRVTASRYTGKATTDVMLAAIDKALLPKVSA